jgi:hypothetical protein
MLKGEDSFVLSVREPCGPGQRSCREQSASAWHVHEVRVGILRTPLLRDATTCGVVDGQCF